MDAFLQPLVQSLQRLAPPQPTVAEPQVLETANQQGQQSHEQQPEAIGQQLHQQQQQHPPPTAVLVSAFPVQQKRLVLDGEVQVSALLDLWCSVVCCRRCLCFLLLSCKEPAIILANLKLPASSSTHLCFDR